MTLVWEKDLFRVSITVMKHSDQKARWGGKGLFSLYFQITVHHGGSQDRNSNRAGAGAEAMEGCWLQALHPLVCSACFLMELKPTSPGKTSLTMARTLPPLITK